MGRPDGSNDWRAALCLRRRNDTTAAAVAVGRYEHGECGSFHDYRTGHKDHEPWSSENSFGLETIRFVYSLRYDVFFSVRDGCEPLKTAEEKSILS